jgi:uncharacterized membrane protein YhiD involved in acid resistance
MDFYQDAGIWIVIASCVAEYLLLITYIAVAAYEFFKNRKMMKKMNVKPENRGQDQSDQESEAKNRDRKDSNNYRGQTDENSDEMDKSKYKNFDGSNEKSRSRSGSSDPDFKEKSIKATSAKNQGKSSLFNSKMMAEMRAVKDKKKQLAMKNPVDGETRIRYVSSLYIPPENN